MSTPNDNQEQLDDAAQREAYELGYCEAKEQFATQGSFSSGRTYDSASLGEAYDIGVNAAEAAYKTAQLSPAAVELDCPINTCFRKAGPSGYCETHKAIAATSEELYWRACYDKSKAIADALRDQLAAETQSKQALQAQRDELVRALGDMLLVANTVRQAERAGETGEGLKTDAYDSEYDRLTLKVNEWDKAARVAIAHATEGGKGQ